MSEMDLFDRVVLSDGGDPDIDYELTKLIAPGAVRHSSAHQHFTSDTDAALFFCEEMGCAVNTLQHSKGFQNSSSAWAAHVIGKRTKDGVVAGKEAVHTSLPLAIIAATLMVSAEDQNP